MIAVLGPIGPIGPIGPSTAINATATTTSATYYPVCVQAAGSNQTPFVRTTATAFSINLNTNILTVTATAAQYADIAERYSADADYPPGTVVQFGGTAEVTKAHKDMTDKVAGVVTTDPAYLMNIQLKSKFTVDVALQGRVPTKVEGPVGKGDMMVATPNGTARAEPNPRIGSVIGKSLEDFVASPENWTTTIEIVVGKS